MAVLVCQIRCLVLLCCSSQWVVATGVKAAYVSRTGDDDSETEADAEHRSEDVTHHFLVPRRLFEALLTEHSTSATITAAIYLALTVGTLNLEGLATSSKHAKLARMLAPRAVDVFDYTQASRRAHRHDTLAMACMATLGLATLSSPFAFEATFGLFMADEATKARQRLAQCEDKRRQRKRAMRRASSPAVPRGGVAKSAMDGGDWERELLLNAAKEAVPAVPSCSPTRRAAAAAGDIPVTIELLAGTLSEMCGFFLGQLSATTDVEIKTTSTFTTILQDVCALGKSPLRLAPWLKPCVQSLTCRPRFVHLQARSSCSWGRGYSPRSGAMLEGFHNVRA